MLIIALDDPKYNLMYEWSLGTRRQITNLDLAVLADYGWEIYKQPKKFLRLSANNNAVSTGADEGESITINIDTDHIVSGATYSYSISGISASDLTSETLNGSVIVDSTEDAKISLDLAADQIREGTENLIFTINSESLTIHINDTSTDFIATILGTSNNDNLTSTENDESGMMAQEQILFH